MPFHVQPHFGSSSWRCTFGDSHAPAVPRRRKFYSTTVSLKTRRSNPCHPSCDPQKRAGFQQLKGHAAAHPSLAEAHTEVPFAKSAEDRAAALSNARPESETSGSYLQGEPPRQAAPILPVLAHFTRRYPKVVLEVLRVSLSTSQPWLNENLEKALYCNSSPPTPDPRKAPRRTVGGAG